MQINPTQAVTGANYGGRSVRAEEQTSAPAEPAGEQVSLSTAGRQIAAAEHQIPGSQAGGVFPVEMYQVPKWQADYMSALPNQLGSRGDWFAQAYPQAAAATMEERGEYSTRLHQHYQELLADNGIQGVEEHYRATILDKASSESLRQQMSERLSGDPRMVELMAKMGKTIS